MALSAEKARYTFADCLNWDENERIEIIDGEAVMMAAPSRIHQKISGEIFRHDRLVKLNLYQRAGVREYWIVDPENRAVQVFLLDDIRYLRICEEYGQKDVAKVQVLEGCFVELEKVFS